MKSARMIPSLFFGLLLFFLTIPAAAYDTSDLTIPTSAEIIVYGTSGAGRDLTAYRFGTGKNVMVVGFAIHGYEDNFQRDGSALVYTAGLLMNLLDENISTVRDYGWSIYVLPCMNPDGLIDGTTNNGPGRCTTTYLNSQGTLVTGSGKGIDMNRSFPYGWVKYSDNRNFNGAAPLASVESQALAQFIQSVKGSGVNICLDVHGWLNQVIPSNGTSSKLYSTLKKAFPGATYANLMNGRGYFGAYAASLGYYACLFEFPGNIYSMSGFRSSGYGEKFNDCILELAKAYGTYQNHAAVCASGAYSDVASDAWYHHAVDYVVKQGAFKGTSTTSFSPEDCLTRAMLATVLYRLGGTAPAASSSFPDVNPNMWYGEAVAWAQENGIMEGYPNGCFGPDDEVTREQMVTVFYRYVQWLGDGTGSVTGDISGFPDHGLVGDYAKDAMEWAVSTKLVKGMWSQGALRLEPLRSMTRAEVAQVFYNYAVATLKSQTALDETVTDEVAAMLAENETMTPPDGEDLDGN